MYDVDCEACMLNVPVINEVLCYDEFFRIFGSTEYSYIWYSIHRIFGSSNIRISRIFGFFRIYSETLVCNLEVDLLNWFYRVYFILKYSRDEVLCENQAHESFSFLISQWSLRKRFLYFLASYQIVFLSNHHIIYDNSRGFDNLQESTGIIPGTIIIVVIHYCIHFSLKH